MLENIGDLRSISRRAEENKCFKCKGYYLLRRCGSRNVNVELDAIQAAPIMTLLVMLKCIRNPSN